MLDDKEAVQQLERQRWHSKEVEGDDDLPVILQKRQPPFTRVASALNSTQIPGDSPLRDNQAELQHLAMEFGGSPVRILRRQSSDQRPDLLSDLRPTASPAGSPTPVQSEAGTVPADDGLGFHDHEHVAPARPEMS